MLCSRSRRLWALDRRLRGLPVGGSPPGGAGLAHLGLPVAGDPGSLAGEADNTVTFKWVVRTIAAEFGLHATFMPKPVFGNWLKEYVNVDQDVKTFGDILTH